MIVEVIATAGNGPIGAHDPTAHAEIAVLLAAGFSANTISMLALVLGIGIVVDDAIVVVENVERHLREGRTPFDAALLGARELVGPIIAMTITLAAVYTPIGLQGGLTGTLFREFALTLAGAVTISGIVALTLSPMMASRLLRSAAEEEKGFTGWVNHQFDKLRQSYGHALDGTLEFPAFLRFRIGREDPFHVLHRLVGLGGGVPQADQASLEVGPHLAAHIDGIAGPHRLAEVVVQALVGVGGLGIEHANSGMRRRWHGAPRCRHRSVRRASTRRGR